MFMILGSIGTLFKIPYRIAQTRIRPHQCKGVKSTAPGALVENPTSETARDGGQGKDSKTRIPVTWGGVVETGGGG